MNSLNVEQNYRYIEVQIEGLVARINLNRPERHNAITPDLLTELNSALNEVSAMDELLFVVLSGNGRSFSAGADLNWFSGSEERTQEHNTGQYKPVSYTHLRAHET